MMITAKKARSLAKVRDVKAETLRLVEIVVNRLEKEIAEAAEAGKLEVTLKRSLAKADAADPVCMLLYPALCGNEYDANFLFHSVTSELEEAGFKVHWHYDYDKEESVMTEPSLLVMTVSWRDEA